MAKSAASLVERLLSESAIQALNAQLDEKGIISNQRLGEHVRNLPDGAAASSYRVLSELLREAASRLSSPEGTPIREAAEYASRRLIEAEGSPEGTRGDDEETPCPKRDDKQHCNCWYDGEACCACGAPASSP